MRFATALRHYGSLVRFSHTIFALPFALAAIVLASRFGDVTLTKILLTIGCVASARTAAMAFNRLVDRSIDARNPRTRDRELPRGTLTVASVRALVVVSSAVFLGLAALLGRLPMLLSPLALLLVLGYSYLKRYTALCHIVLGLAIAFAPGGAWIAMGAPLNVAAPWLLVLAVATWVAGFDVLYALQDETFDKANSLRSIPARFGVGGALVISALLHVVTLASFVALGLVLHLGTAYWAGATAIVLLLLIEHAIVRPSDLSKVNRAFFDLNGYVSLVFFGCVWLDRLMTT